MCQVRRRKRQHHRACGDYRPKIDLTDAATAHNRVDGGAPPTQWQWPYRVKKPEFSAKF
jgi:hypothetical protein